MLFQYLLVLLLQIIETTLILFFNPVNLLRKHILLVHVAGKLFLVFFPDSLNIVISQSLQFFQVFLGQKHVSIIDLLRGQQFIGGNCNFPLVHFFKLLYLLNSLFLVLLYFLLDSML